MFTEKVWYWFGVGLLVLTVSNSLIQQPIVWARSWVEQSQDRFDQLAQTVPVAALANLQATVGETQAVNGRRLACLQSQLGQMQAGLARRQAAFARAQAQRAQLEVMQQFRRSMPCPHRVLSISYSEPTAQDASELSEDGDLGK
jgi:hypothetical protein